MEYQLTVQKYEEVRFMTHMNEYNTWARKTIMEKGVASFVQSPFPDRLPAHEHGSAQLLCEPTCVIARDGLTDVLMTAILNLMTEGVAI